MNRAATIARFGASYTVTRKAATTYTAGRAVAGATDAPITIVASVQPVTGRELKALPEGRRAEDVRILFTTTELRTESPAGAADQVTIGGELYEVFQVKPWTAHGGTHYEVLAARQGPVP